MREVARGRHNIAKLFTAKLVTTKLVIIKLVAARRRQLVLYSDADPAAGATRGHVRDLQFLPLR
jgi:hypothetical protein